MPQIVRASPACWKTIRVAIEGGWGTTLRLITIFAVFTACAVAVLFAAPL